MSVFELSMLVCFGVSWPVSIIKTLRTRIVTGKSPLFLAIIALGYVCGIFHKVLFSFDGVLLLYILNLLMVTSDIALYYRFKRNIG